MLGHGFYMVKFDEAEDRTKVISGGPWMVFDHYLSIRLWTPEFNAKQAFIDKTLVWVRVPSLNVLFYDESFLTTLASAIGQPVKVDLYTLRVARGRFARVCVEIDLNKPVVGRVGINGQWFKVEYEGVHIICANCGCYGHVLKDCPVKPKETSHPVAAVVPTNNGGIPETDQAGTKAPQEKEIPKYHEGISQVVMDETLHGEWLVVTRKKRAPRGNVNNGPPKMKGSSQKNKSAGFEHLRADILEDLFQQTQNFKARIAEGNPSKDERVQGQEQKNWNNVKKKET